MEIILKYFSDLTQQQLKHFAQLQPIYYDWNEKINVISRKDMDNFYERHVLHSLSIAKVIHFQTGTRVVDVGTGGGFPAIPLAIFFPEVKFHLIDSIGKKIKVVSEVIRHLGLTNATCEQIRSEDLKNKYDFVVSRAVAEVSTFYQQTKHLLKKEGHNELSNGFLMLKGGDLLEEFANVKGYFKFYALKDFFEEEFFETKKIAYLKFML
ncbi:16S rRNA (guanine(527)-N(7))-methyltransferase RsmG [Thermoflexibacter ruber]|uniref:Ribosomal RNA small subunit methyltransferase G n=1 Tax=Thermoflexibacter ruber TaxID=1003 RepID=A0A1I2HU09_9BACT|nr:16S rRNA (guanine(527)-N(7))-methyltransferase RsmG [Thermoflexibacter ruber]SFF33118.1 16S rRNA m(7)G-527 methyltransferase [Thermoflexibacter ruber]